MSVPLQDVKFAYNSGREVLRGINLTIEPGQSVAFVGGSGSGKSTVLKLLMRLYDVSSGTVHVNGVDVRDLKQVIHIYQAPCHAVDPSKQLSSAPQQHIVMCFAFLAHRATSNRLAAGASQDIYLTYSHSGTTSFISARVKQPSSGQGCPTGSVSPCSGPPDRVGHPVRNPGWQVG